MNKKLVFFFASALAIAGCAKEPQQTETPVGQDAQDANFSLLASSDVFSKTELHECKDILWKADDCLSVWEKGSASNSNVKLTLDAASADSQVGLFKGTLTPAADFELYAIYPYNAEYGNDPAALTLTIPETVDQSDDVNSIVGDTDFMLGKASSEEFDSESGAYKMLFKHPLAFVQFHIDGRDCVYEQATIKSLTMTADKAFVGPVTVNLEEGTVTSAAEGEVGKTLVINFPETAKMKDPQDAWVAINPVDLSDANCQFILEMTNGQKVTFKVNPNKMNGQALYKFEFMDIDAKIASKKGTPTYVDILSTTGGQRANCYIVSEGGYYKFAAQKVNNKENCFEGTNPYSAGYRANWLWATGTETKVDEVSLGNSGNINFRVKPNANGNTIIALYNPDGEIVWSWHIWCTTMGSVMTPHHYTRNTSWLMSDINIGATSKNDGDVNSYGMYYQWGRKDPFPADKSNCVFNGDANFSTIHTIANKTPNVTEKSLSYTIAHPMTFLYQNGKRTWISADEAADAQSLWNNTGSGKTNYDPCPSGYRVPHNWDYAWYTYWVADNITVNTTGLTYTYDGVSTYYPAAGYLNDGVLTDAGLTARYWLASLSATPSANANMLGYSLLYTLSTSTTKKEGSRAGFALPVRCMKQ